MNWSSYSTLKAAGNISFASDKETTREAVEEVSDSDGNVTTPAKAKEEREYVVLVTKCWDASTGNACDDNRKEYSLSNLESEKARYDREIAKAQVQSDELAKAITDFKKV